MPESWFESGKLNVGLTVCGIHNKLRGLGLKFQDLKV